MNIRKINTDSVYQNFLQIRGPMYGAPLLSSFEVNHYDYFPKNDADSHYWVKIVKLFDINPEDIEKVIAVDGINFDCITPIAYIVLKMPTQYLYIKSEIDIEGFDDLIEDTQHNHAYLSTHESLNSVLETIKNDTEMYSYLLEQHEYNLKEETEYTSGLTILNRLSILSEVEHLENHVPSTLNQDKKSIKL
jgi:hypothetical protein